MNWKTRFPVGLALLAALMLAGGVSAATSMKLASAKVPTVLLSQEESEDPGEDGDVGEPEPAGEAPPAEESDPPEEPDQPEGDVEDGHGGSVERFHEGCAFPGLVAVPDGNWTHGDYVSAWAKAGDHEAHVAAAHSSCGKPMKAVEKSKKDKKDKDRLSTKGKGKAHGKGGRGKSHKHSS
jgi:hypothetical protein